MNEGPDQGFAWVVALACFFINFIMSGLARTAGVLYVAVIHLYGVSREEATTPFSIRVCVRNMTGPLIGLLGQKYGIRGLTVIGGGVAALGSILCCFAPNVLWITILWGVIHGLGFGLSTVLHMMVINQYFHKYKASALGLGYSGDCIGTFAFPVIIEYLLSNYGLRSTFLIIGGIVLNVVPLALLLRKPPWIERGINTSDVKQTNINRSLCSIPNNRSNMNLAIRYNGSRLNVDQMDKASQTSSADLESLDAMSVTGCVKSLKLDTPPIYENIPPTIFEHGKMIPSTRYHLSGQCNLAFKSSGSDISSLNDPIEMKISNLKHPFPTQELKMSSICPSNENSLASKRNRSFQCVPQSSLCSSNSSINYCKNIKADNLSSVREIRKIRSVSDLNLKNDSLSPLSKSPWLNRVLKADAQNRRDSLPPVLEKETNFKSKIRSISVLNKENDELDGADVDSTYVSKKRTSSFVGTVAHEIVNRLRTASFASQVASDGFCSSFPQETESLQEPEMECELKAIVEHKGHDMDSCTNRDLVLSVDKNMVEDYLKGIPEKPFKVKEKQKSSMIWKQMLRTNTKPMFILISISMAVYAFLFIGVLTVIIDYAKDLGISNDRGKFLIIGFSVTDLFGRLSFGQVIDRNMMKMKNYSGCTMLIMGTAVAAIPLNVSFNYMMVCMCMYGFVQGGTAIMFPILVNMYFDKNEEAVAMGCLNFYGGLLMLLMAPMIGFYRDSMGSYNCVFYIIGGVVAVVGVLWQFEPMIVKYQNKKLREKYIMKEMAAFQEE